MLNDSAQKRQNFPKTHVRSTVLQGMRLAWGGSGQNSGGSTMVIRVSGKRCADSATVRTATRIWEAPSAPHSPTRSQEGSPPSDRAPPPSARPHRKERGEERPRKRKVERPQPAHLRKAEEHMPIEHARRKGRKHQPRKRQPEAWTPPPAASARSLGTPHNALLAPRLGDGAARAARGPPAGCSAPRRNRRASTCRRGHPPQTASPVLRDRRAHRRGPDRPDSSHRSARGTPARAQANPAARRVDGSGRIFSRQPPPRRGQDP